jgi:hypothetical protein
LLAIDVNELATRLGAPATGRDERGHSA